MVTIMSLWLAILLSAVLVFIVSSVIHMLLPYHRSDFAKLPREDDVRRALQPLEIPPGEYMVPFAGTPEAMKSDEHQQKVNEGPVMFMTVYPKGPIAMGASLGQWFAYCVVVSIFAAYLTTRTVGADAEYVTVFRLVGTVAFLGYAVALWQNSIWYKRKWSTTLKSTFDALIYSLLTAGVFGWQWPN